MCIRDSSSSDLWNIFNGITDSENKVTAENADIIGRNIQDKLTSKLFKDETLLKSNQAVTMQVLRKGIVIAGETHRVDSRLLTQRMLACISLDNQDEYKRQSKQRDDKIHELFNPMPTGAVTCIRQFYQN